MRSEKRAIRQRIRGRDPSRYVSIAWKHPDDKIRNMYTTNLFAPRARMNAVKLVRSGWSMRKVARYFGASPSTISKWCRKAPSDFRQVISTESSRPHYLTNRVSKTVVDEIIAKRFLINSIKKHLVTTKCSFKVKS